MATTNSIPSGDIGQKTSKDNLLTYAVTTDGTMSTITEKVNGVTVGTKTATGGQSLTVALTQAQWDAVRYGKYQEIRKSESLISLNPVDWERASIKSGGVGQAFEKVSSADFIITKSAIPVNKNTDYSIVLSAGYIMYVFELDITNTITKQTTFGVSGGKFITTPKADRVYLSIRKDPTTPIELSEINIAKPIMTFYPVLPNTLTIEMGTEVWTYTFDKIPPVDAQITELLKSHIDSADVSTPAKKSLLGASIRGKGGTVNDTDSLEVMASAIGGIPLGKKKVTGTITSSSSTGPVIDYNGANTSNIYVAFNMANIPFIPSVIEFIRTDKASLAPSAVWHKNNHYINGSNYANSFSGSTAFRVPYANAIVNIPVAGSGMSIEWTAYEE